MTLCEAIILITAENCGAGGFGLEFDEKGEENMTLSLLFLPPPCIVNEH